MPIGDIRLSPALTTHQMDLIMLWLRNYSYEGQDSEIVASGIYSVTKESGGNK